MPNRFNGLGFVFGKKHRNSQAVGKWGGETTGLEDKVKRPFKGED